MSDFNLPNLMTWKKIDFSFENLTNDKKKLGAILIIVISLVFIFTASFLKINSLQEEKIRHEMELSLLRESGVQAKKMAERDRENIRRLNSRVDNIITSENPDYSTLGVSTYSSKSSDVNQNSENVTNNQLISPNPTGILTSKGKIEVYDPSRKSIDIYKDATTISQIVGKKNVGEILEYYQYSSGWYKVSVDSNWGWINEKNTRSIK